MIVLVIIFATDSNGGVVIADIWKRKSDRINSNIVIIGKSGGR
ncbi:hypothetical protein [[Clostridium] colinum]|nr:hypothetical protein [[Clostridium] colinum]